MGASTLTLAYGKTTLGALSIEADPGETGTNSHRFNVASGNMSGMGVGFSHDLGGGASLVAGFGQVDTSMLNVNVGTAGTAVGECHPVSGFVQIWRQQQGQYRIVLLVLNRTDSQHGKGRLGPPLSRSGRMHLPTSMLPKAWRLRTGLADPRQLGEGHRMLGRGTRGALRSAQVTLTAPQSRLILASSCWCVRSLQVLLVEPGTGRIHLLAEKDGMRILGHGSNFR